MRVVKKLSPQVKALPPGMGIPLWVGERCRAGLSLLLSIQQGGPPRPFFGFSQFTTLPRRLAFLGESLFRCRMSGFPKMLTLVES